MFSQCVARVPVSFWGSGTVCNRLCEDRMAVPIGSCPGGVIFGSFTCHVASFRIAGVALRDMWTCLLTCRKSFCVVGAILLWRFHNTRCIFTRQAQHFGRVHVHVSWPAQHFRRVVLRLFANRIGKAAQSGDKVQIAWQVWYFVRCDEIWRNPRTKHRFWAIKFSASSEQLVGKRRFLSCNLSKLEEVSHEMLVLKLQHVLSRVCGFPLALVCPSGKLQSHTLHFTLRTSHSTLHTPHSTLYTQNSKLKTLNSTLHTLHFTLHTPHFTLYTLHSTLHTLHSSLHTLHFTLHTSHSTLYTLHFTL